MYTKANLTDYLELYLVTDQEALLGKPFLKTVEEAILAGVSLVQYREKHKPYAVQVEEARALKALCDQYQIPLIINDDLRLATAVEAYGAHVGQSDLEAGAARAFIGQQAVLGVSVSTIEEALVAQQAGADYLGVGAMFPTSTKLDADAVSVETLSAICKAVDIPVVAIGGINQQNVTTLKSSGIAGVAIVSAILSSPEVSLATQTLSDLLKKEVLL